METLLPIFPCPAMLNCKSAEPDLTLPASEMLDPTRMNERTLKLEPTALWPNCDPYLPT
jgi:hypothetical protein